MGDRCIRAPEAEGFRALEEDQIGQVRRCAMVGPEGGASLDAEDIESSE